MRDYSGPDFRDFVDAIDEYKKARDNVWAYGTDHDFWLMALGRAESNGIAALRNILNLEEEWDE